MTQLFCTRRLKTSKDIEKIFYKQNLGYWLSLLKQYKENSLELDLELFTNLTSAVHLSFSDPSEVFRCFGLIEKRSLRTKNFDVIFISFSFGDDVLWCLVKGSCNEKLTSLTNTWYLRQGKLFLYYLHNFARKFSLEISN